MKKSLRVVLLAFAAFVLIEGAHRAFFHLHELMVTERFAGKGDLVLLLGDEYVVGSSAEKGISYPEQLLALLQKRFSGQAPGLAAVGYRNLNAEEALRALPGTLRKFRPKVLVLQLGEANLWNRRYLDSFQQQKPGVLDFFSQLKTVEVISSFGRVESDLENSPSERGPYLLNDEILAWTYHDLAAIVHLAHENGVPVLLMTYPPERFSGRERPVDPVIRRVASDLNVPLSDISNELSRRWSGRALDQYYGTKGLSKQDDHLNREGNALVADILADDLVRYRLIRP